MEQQRPVHRQSPDDGQSPDHRQSPDDRQGLDPSATPLDGEIRLHACRVLAAARTGPRVEVHLLASSGERVDLFAHLAVAGGAAASRPRTGAPDPSGVRAPAGGAGGPVRSWPAPPGPLPQVFAFTFATPDAAAAELVVVDHWGRHGILVEAWTSGLNQAAVLWDPATGVTTGVRLPLGT